MVKCQRIVVVINTTSDVKGLLKNTALSEVVN